MSSTLSKGLTYIATQQLKQFVEQLNSDDDTNSSVVYPLIYSSDVVKTKNTSPFLMVNPVGNTGVQYTYGRFTDLNKDKRIIKQITKYFMYKILDKWIYNDFKNLLKYVKFIDGNPALIRDASELKSELVSSETSNDVEQKIDYLSKILINKKVIKHILKKIVNENNIQWTQLGKNKSSVKKIIRKYLQSKLEDAVKSVSN